MTKIKLKKLKFLIIGVLFIAISCSKDNLDDEAPIDINDNSSINLFTTEARVVGYLPYYRFSLNNQIEYCKLTHLNIAFANPLPDGKIVLSKDNSNVELSDIINKARSENNNIKIYISLAGGALSATTKNTWKNFLSNSSDRETLIEEIFKFTSDNNLDGVDVDLEWDAVTAGYSDFILELKEKLSSNSLGLTAAFPSETKYTLLTNEALNAFDFVNIMAYDYTGPWNPSSPGQHSSLNHAKQGVNYWKNSIGLDGLKLNLGVPFYGYNFINSQNVEAFTYASMVTENNSYADLDNVGNKYYNGRPTISAKVKHAAENIGGIMIWEIGQDSFNEFSLLSTIHENYTKYKVKTTNLCGN